MPSRIVGALNSYDLFAKSMPGVVLLIGTITLLPQSVGDGSTQQLIGLGVESSFANFAAAIITVLLLGFLLGEGVHILGYTVERLGFKGARWTRANLLAQVVVKYDNLVGQKTEQPAEETLRARLKEVDTEEVDGSNVKVENIPSDMEIRYAFPEEQARVGESPENSAIRNGIQRIRHSRVTNFCLVCLERSYWKSHNIFKPHRLLFADYIEWNYSEEEGPWKEQKGGKIFDEFVETFQTNHDIDLRYETDKEDLPRLYPLVTSRLNMGQTGLAERFQVTYSFCRSMWVIFIFLTLSYIIILSPVLIGGGSTCGIPLYRPRGLVLVPSNQYAFVIPGLTGFTTLLYLHGTGVYKRYFVEYLLADYHMLESLEE